MKIAVATLKLSLSEQVLFECAALKTVCTVVQQIELILFDFWGKTTKCLLLARVDSKGERNTGHRTSAILRGEKD